MPRITYKYAEETLLTGRCKKRRKVGNHTYIERDEADPAIFHLRLWRSRIATLYPDGSARLDSCGYQTITTLDRMRWVLPRDVGLFSGCGYWFIWSRMQNLGKEQLFTDGVLVDAACHIQGATPGSFAEKQKEYRRDSYQRNKLFPVEKIGGFELGDVVRYRESCYIAHKLYSNQNCRQVMTLKSLEGEVVHKKIALRQWGYGKMTKDEFLTAVHRRGQERLAVVA